VLGSVSSAYWLIGSAFAPTFLRQHLWSRALELSLIPYGCFFAVGTLTYLHVRDGRSQVRMLGMGVFIAAGLLEIAYKTRDFSTSNGIHEAAWLPQCLFLLAIASVSLSMRRFADRSGRLVGWLRLIGLATYPLYLFHQVIGVGFMKVALAAGASRYAALLAAIGLCLIGSILIAKLVEPLIRSRLRTAILSVCDLPLWHRFRRPPAVTAIK
jgi:peptidoglycan/LPS O-acetylase OafA/YrhL